MAAEIMLGQAGWLTPGRFRWARALLWLLVLAVLCIFAFNLAADASLRLAAAASGDAFTTRAAAPTGARLFAVVIGAVAMLGAYALAVGRVERRKIPELGLVITVT